MIVRRLLCLGLFVFVFDIIFLSEFVIAATVRGKVVVDADKIRLSDLFENLEPGQDRVLGPSPPPGESIQVEGGQLIAIADEYGVDWMDQSSSAIVNITRAGRVLDREFFEKVLKANLGIEREHVSIVFSGFQPIIVPKEAQDPVSLSDISWNRETGYVTSTVYRKDNLDDFTKKSFLLKGFVKVSHPVWVFSRALEKGRVIDKQDLHIDENYSGKVYNTSIINDENQIIGMTLQKDVRAGDLVLEEDFRKTVLIKKGSPVIIFFEIPGVHLTVAGKALENGGLDQYIHALNLASGAKILGKVINSSSIQVYSALSPEYGER